MNESNVNMHQEGEVLHPSIKALLVRFLVTMLPLLFLKCILSLTISEYFGISSSNNGYKLIALIVILEMVREYFNDVYVFYNDSVSYKGGRLSLRYRNIILKYTDIREIRVSQSIPGRILDYGTVAISTAATGNEELICRMLDNPTELSDKLQENIARLKKEHIKSHKAENNE